MCPMIYWNLRMVPYDYIETLVPHNYYFHDRYLLLRVSRKKLTVIFILFKLEVNAMNFDIIYR